MAEEKLSPVVTVIIAGNATRACLESVLAQAFKDFEFEVIVVGDDPKIDDPRLRIIAGKKILNAARNAGLNVARGKYVYFVDIDSRLYANGLEILNDAAETSDADIVRITTFIERDGDNKKSVTDQNLLALNLYRREFLERCGLLFPESTDDDKAFLYAAECCASSVETFGRYFYVRDRKKNLRAESEETYVRDIHRDEIRDGFLVTAQRKKLWNAQIKLIMEFARICRKHNLKWFAGYGTLLGAARHKGFIPWDDDVDLIMPRPDYAKFVKVAGHAIKPEYFLDVWYEHAWANETNDEHLPVLSTETLEKVCAKGWWPVFAGCTKLRDNNTAMIQWPERRNVHQGIWIDIIPFDAVPPFDDEQRYINFEIEKELMIAAGNPSVLIEAMHNGEELMLSYDKIKSILSKPFKQRALIYEEYVEKHFFDADYFSRLVTYVLRNARYKWSKTYFRETIHLPFEEIELPAPIDYEDLLADHYGEWRKMFIKHSHVTAYSTDISYREYFEKVSPGIRVHMY